MGCWRTAPRAPRHKASQSPPRAGPALRRYPAVRKPAVRWHWHSGEPPLVAGRPRVVLRYANANERLVSGLLTNGAELPQAAAVVDVPAGESISDEGGARA